MGVASVYTWDIGETKISAAMTRAPHNKAQVYYIHHLTGIVSQIGVASVYTWDVGETKISAAMTRASHNKAQVYLYHLQMGVASVYTWDIGETKISAAMTRASHNKAQVYLSSRVCIKLNPKNQAGFLGGLKTKKKIFWFFLK